MPLSTTPLRCGSSPWRRPASSAGYQSLGNLGNLGSLGSLDDVLDDRNGALALIPGRPMRERQLPRAQTKDKVPAWFRGFGSQFALLCAALAGIMPLVAFAFLAYFSDDTGTSQNAAAVPTPAAHSFPIMPAYSYAEGSLHSRPPDMERLLANFEDFRLELRRQQESLVLAQTAASSRLGRLESMSSSQKTVTSPDLATLSAESSPLLGLGVDWAALWAGAEIDEHYTSPGLGRDVLGRTARVLSWMLPRYRTSFGNVSHPPAVALATDHGPPSKCFTLGANGGSVAVRFLIAVEASHVALEGLPPWAVFYPKTTPRRVEVRGWIADDPEPYSAVLADFEYQLTGPRIQIFDLKPAGKLRAVQFRFAENWGGDFISVCRVRVLGPGPGN